MRRTDKEVKDLNWIESVINKATVCRLGLSNNDRPYVIPLNFGYQHGYLYFHSLKKGKKMDMLKSNHNVCFEVDIESELIRGEGPCDWTMKYSSVIGFGKVSILEDTHAKKNGLDIIMEHYSPGQSYEYSESELRRVVVIKVHVENITGKKSD